MYPHKALDGAVVSALYLGWEQAAGQLPEAAMISDTFAAYALA